MIKAPFNRHYISTMKRKIVSSQSIAGLATGLLILTVITLLYQREKPFLPKQIQAAIAFTDIKDEALKEDLLLNASLHFLKAKEIMKGYDDGTFKPENPINRAEFMKILAAGIALNQINDKKISCFKDVKSEEWYAKYVCHGKEKNWIKGYPDGFFKPADTISQAEITKILVTAMGWSLEEAQTQSLPEKVKSEEWYTPYYRVALKKNIIDMEAADPGKLLNRKEVATMLFKAMLIDALKISEYKQEKIQDLFTITNIVFSAEAVFTEEAKQK